jgi:hypothetical protein
MWAKMQGQAKLLQIFAIIDQEGELFFNGQNIANLSVWAFVRC